jgi:L-cysteate sulfo-lyase
VLTSRDELLHDLRTRTERAAPRIPLAYLPTPLVPCRRLSRFASREIWMKRDDCTGLALGGNKTRHLEFILGQARLEESDTIVFGAAAQSNFARQLAAACASLGLGCHLVLTTYYGQSTDRGNAFLDRMFGAEIQWAELPLGQPLNEATAQEAARLRRGGRRPYLISGPQADVLGAISYVLAGFELEEQLEERQLRPEAIYLAAVGPTQAGLVVAAKALGWNTKVIGVAPTTNEFRVTHDVLNVARLTEKWLGFLARVEAEDVLNLDTYAGDSYGRPSGPGADALRRVARLEGILLDPVYTSKAMSALLDRANALPERGTAIFWHTGGVPAVFAFEEQLLGESVDAR